MDDYRKNIIGSLINSCVEGIEYISGKIHNKQYDIETSTILTDIQKAVFCIDESIDKSLEDEFKTIKKYCQNIEYSINEVLIGRRTKEDSFFLEISPMIYEMKRHINFVINVLHNKEQWEAYRNDRKDIFKKFSTEPPLINKYKVSIVLIAYNKLEYTKKAVESIYKYTDFSTGDVELITVDNGSGDGTWEYFNTLPNLKKIHLQNNILGNTIHHYNTEGEYIVGFSNDVIATPRWLDNLLKCIESDENIFWVVPTCNESGISNNQGIATNYPNTFEAIPLLENFANKYNYSDPSKWEERSLLMPFICIARRKFIQKGDGLDLLYSQSEFSDDDFSTALRRSGLKQILAKDTFMHHFGSVTLRDERKNGSLENMREVYYKKWGVDAWDSRGEVEGFEELLKYDIYDNPKILFIEPKFGTNTLNIKKILRDKGIKVSKMVAAIFDRRYLPDARYMYDQIIAVNSTKEIIEDEEKYSLISFGTYINEIEKEDIIAFLESLYHKLENKGQIIFTIKNFRNAKIIFDLLTNNPLEVCGYEKIDFHGCDFDRLFEILSQNELLNSFEVNAIYKHTKEVDLILSLDDSINKMTASAIERLKNEIGTKYYTFVINKNG